MTEVTTDRNNRPVAVGGIGNGAGQREPVNSTHGQLVTP